MPPKIINEHEYNDIGRCVWCGCAAWPQVYAYHEKRGRLKDLPELDPRSCIDRIAPHLAPEPARREYAVEDIDVIFSRIVQLKAERVAIWNAPEESTSG